MPSSDPAEISFEIGSEGSDAATSDDPEATTSDDPEATTSASSAAPPVFRSAAATLAKLHAVDPAMFPDPLGATEPVADAHFRAADYASAIEARGLAP